MNKRYIKVKFDSSNKYYTFYTTATDIKENDFVIVETSKGIELATVAGEIKVNGENENIIPIIRKASKEDIKIYQINKALAKQAKSFCQIKSDEEDLQMNVVAAFYTLDRTKLSIHYISEDRVDFRNLLKVLASQFKCRIDLRQIGSRDNAAIVSGIGVCGRRLCCASHIKDFEKITINMVKNQGLSINNQKISGQCGNLMCCLKYEDEAYTVLKQNLPALNTKVIFEDREYIISSYNVIAGTAKIINDTDLTHVKISDLKKLKMVKR